MEASTKQCSYLTIQSDPQGQFGRLLSHIESLPEYETSHLPRFAGLENDAQRLDFVRRHFLSCIELKPVFKVKSEDEAEQARLSGNELFKRKKFREARNHYNKSVLQAPARTALNTLALSVGNRSACSFHMHEYENAISDAHLSLALGYPQEKRLKIYIRLAKCHIKLKEYGKAITNLMVAGSMLETKGDDSANEVEKLLKEAKESAARDGREPKPSKQQTSSSTNCEELQCSLAEVRYSPSVGRYVTASSDVRAGEVILSEAAYAAALYPERFGTNCQTCFRRLDVVVGCEECSGVAFCSMECRERGKVFHQYECKYVDLLSGFGCSQVSRLALRMLTKRPAQDFLRMKRDFREIDESKELKSNRDGYLRVFNLVSNNDSRWPEDHLRRCLMAGILFGILKSSGYLPKGLSGEEEIMFGKLLLRNLQVLQFNAHEVYEAMRSSRDSLTPWKNQTVGLAIYPTASYLNHSCHGGVARTFEGNRLTVRALRPLKKGDEICENYGPSFYLKDREKRRKELKMRYWFDCNCKPCEEDWPLLANLPNDVNLAKNKSFVEGKEALGRGKVTEAKDLLSEAINGSRASIDGRWPTEERLRAEDKLRTCLSNLGNVVFLEANQKK